MSQKDLIRLAVVVGAAAVFAFWWLKRQENAKKAAEFQTLGSDMLSVTGLDPALLAQVGMAVQTATAGL
jgi:hypothetical protein